MSDFSRDSPATPEGGIELIFDRHYVKRATARVTARFWLLSKMLPRQSRERT
jgi:hypothetical protein